jgi:hypothetical protein
MPIEAASLAEILNGVQTMTTKVCPQRIIAEAIRLLGASVVPGKAWE